MPKNKKELVEALTELINGDEATKFSDVAIDRTAAKIGLPSGMSPREGIKWLERLEAEENEVVAIAETIVAHPLDGAHAFWHVLKDRFGWTNMVPKASFFGGEPPRMVSVETGVHSKETIAWGRVQIPGVSGFLETQFANQTDRPMFAITGNVKRKDLAKVMEVVEAVRARVKVASIYRGKAVRVRYPPKDERYNPFEYMPSFFDTTHVQPSDLIFDATTQEILEWTLFTPIRATAFVRALKVPLKRGVCLEGPPGTGKTLTGAVAAKLATENGWTFFYLDNLLNLERCLEDARNFQPSVVFGEDIDRLDTRGNDALNRVLNIIDGVKGKNDEVMVIVTTNKPESLTEQMLRPGRLDAVVSMRAPDAYACERLMRLYAQDRLAWDEPIKPAAAKLAGEIPAVVREVVERAKLAAAGRMLQSGEPLLVKNLHLTGADLETAADSMMAHIRLLRERANRTDPNAIEQFATALGEQLVSSFHYVREDHEAGFNDFTKQSKLDYDLVVDQRRRELTEPK